MKNMHQVHESGSTITRNVDTFNQNMKRRLYLTLAFGKNNYYLHDCGM